MLALKNILRHLRPPYPRALLVLGVCVVFIALYVVSPYVAGLRVYSVGTEDFYANRLSNGAFMLLLIYAALFLSVSVGRFSLLVAWMIWGFTGVADYMERVFHSRISKDSIAVAIEMTGGELKTFAQSTLLLHVGLALGVATLCTLAVRRFEKRDANNRKVAVLAAIIVISSSAGGLYHENYAPYNFLVPAYEYSMERVHRLYNTRFDIATLGAQWPKAAGERPIVVVIIGESARADHLSLNGYARETTPLLSARTHMLNFSHAESCGVFTRVSVGCMLTRATRSSLMVMERETSIIGLFKHVGFHTAWLGAQGYFSANDPTTAIIKESDEHLLIGDVALPSQVIRDQDLLAPLDAVLNKNKDSLFVVLHLMGSHWQYDWRYPPEFERFKPVCGQLLTSNPFADEQSKQIAECGRKNGGVVNAYDNSILYTDYVIDQVMKRVEDKNAVVVYVSDHGESLGEEGRWLHGHEDAPDNYHVPFVWWASDRFVSSHEEAWSNLAAAAKKGEASQDNLFHSLLGCVGAESGAYDPALDLCRKR